MYCTLGLCTEPALHSQSTPPHPAPPALCGSMSATRPLAGSIGLPRYSSGQVADYAFPHRVEPDLTRLSIYICVYIKEKERESGGNTMSFNLRFHLPKQHRTIQKYKSYSIIIKDRKRGRSRFAGAAHPKPANLSSSSRTTRNPCQLRHTPPCSVLF